MSKLIFLVAIALSLTARAAVQLKEIEYKAGDQTMLGYLAHGLGGKATWDTVADQDRNMLGSSTVKLASAPPLPNDLPPDTVEDGVTAVNATVATVDDAAPAPGA